MFFETLSAVRDISRLHDIASILIRYGFGDIVKRLGLAGFLKQANRLLHWKAVDNLLELETHQRIRQAMEELGPTFVKFGQLLATRVDLFPPEWIEEFSQLQNAVPPLEYSEILPQLTEDLGGDPLTIFRDIETTAFASASLAQTHRAWLKTGEAVILKIRRPNIRTVIEADLRLLNRLAAIIETQIPDWSRYRPAEMVQHITLSLRQELDFAGECHNAEIIANNFKNNKNIIIPKVYWEWTGERLNVQEFLTGISGRDLVAVDQSGLNRKQLAKNGAAIILKMILQDGYFHADPHPGNLFYLPDNKIGLIDFGMVGNMFEQRRYQVACLLHGLADHDVNVVTDILLEWSYGSELQQDQLQADIDRFISRYRHVPLKRLSLAAMLSDITQIMRQHCLTLPADLALAIKAVVTLEGMGRGLDPDFDMANEARPLLKKVLLHYYSPQLILKRSRVAAQHSLELANDLPRDLRRLLKNASSGNFKTQLEIPDLINIAALLSQAINRLAMGLIVAALILSSAILLYALKDTYLISTKLSAGFGVFIAFIGVIWVLFLIWRSRRNGG